MFLVRLIFQGYINSVCFCLPPNVKVWELPGHPPLNWKDRDWIIPCLTQIHRKLSMQASGSTAFRQTKQPLRDLLPLGPKFTNCILNWWNSQQSLAWHTVCNHYSISNSVWLLEVYIILLFYYFNRFESGICTQCSLDGWFKMKSIILGVWSRLVVKLQKKIRATKWK